MTCWVTSLQSFSRVCVFILGESKSKKQIFSFGSCCFKLATIIYLLLTCWLKACDHHSFIGQALGVSNQEGARGY